MLLQYAQHCMDEKKKEGKGNTTIGTIGMITGSVGNSSDTRLDHQTSTYNGLQPRQQLQQEHQQNLRQQ